MFLFSYYFVGQRIVSGKAHTNVSDNVSDKHAGSRRKSLNHKGCRHVAAMPTPSAWPSAKRESRGE